MDNKVILLIIQALSYEIATTKMNYMNELVGKGKARFYELDMEKASLLKPLYEDVFEGTDLFVNAMINNQVIRRQSAKNIFQITRDNGLKTGAAAYYWFGETYNEEKLKWQEHKEKIDEASNIQYATYYGHYSYRDSDVFTDSEYIRKKYNPNLLLVHSMGIEHVSIKYGEDTQEFREKVFELDNTLELMIPIWIEGGYQIIVTTEKRISISNNAKDNEKVVPVWTIGEKINKDNYENSIKNTGIPDTIFKVLGIKKPRRFINSNIF